MKKLTLFLIAFVMAFTSCKPEPEGNENNGSNSGEANKVKVSCSIPINKGTRSDFTGLFEDGVINWSDGRECVYLAIPGDEPKVVELEGYCDGYKPEIEFIAYVDENLLTAGESYDIWYFGHSQQLDSAYVSLVDGNKIEGSIAKQTGRLEDLGYSHIASTSVKAVMENGEVKLPLVGTLKNRMAIALVDLYTITELNGSAVNTDYALEFNTETGRYEFNIIEDDNASIEIKDALSGISYLALLPNENNKVELEGIQYGFGIEYTFYNGIKENKIYYKLDENENMTNLTWQTNAYVDLGLSVKWAVSNVGANTPEEYGNYYAWGEIDTKSDYTNNSTNGNKPDISGNIQYDAATANWGNGWRMPTNTEMTELKNDCEWIMMTYNGVSGYKVIGPNGNYIFIPMSGSYEGTSLKNVGTKGYLWTSTPDYRTTSDFYSGYIYHHYDIAYGLLLEENNITVSSSEEYRKYGKPIRPVVD